MHQARALSLVLLASLIVVAACAKQSESNTSSEATGAATSAATEASASGGALPIALAKLPAAAVGTGDVAGGAKLFSANCESCHGAGAKNGTVGPTLAGTGIKAGQVAYMIKNPQAIDPSSGMPKIPLTDKQIADVSAYVASLK